MNIAISHIAWDNALNTEVSEVLQKHHIDAIETAPTKVGADIFKITQKETEQFRTFWNDKKISLVAMQSLLFGQPQLSLFGDPETQKKTREYLYKVIDIAQELGVTKLVFGSPKNRYIPEGMDTHTATQMAVAFFETLADYAGPKKVFFCIEPNPSEYGCNFITNSLQAIELIKQVNHPYFQLHLDSAIMTMNNENIGQTISVSAPFLNHFHISEKKLSPIGTTAVPHHDFTTALRKISYSGYTSIEMLIPPTANAISTIQSSLTYAQNIYGKI